MLPAISSAAPPPSPALSVCRPLAESVIVLPVIVVPREWLEEIASLASLTTLFVIEPAPPKLKIAIDAGSDATCSTVLWSKEKLPPLEA